MNQKWSLGSVHISSDNSGGMRWSGSYIGRLMSLGRSIGCGRGRIVSLGGSIRCGRRMSLGGRVGGRRLIWFLVQDHLLEDEVEGSTNQQLTYRYTNDESPSGNSKASCKK